MTAILARARAFVSTHPRTVGLLAVAVLALLLVLGTFGDGASFSYNSF